MPINQTQQVTAAIVEAYEITKAKHNDFVTPEHLLAGFLKDRGFWEVYLTCGRAQELEDKLYSYINELDTMPEGKEDEIGFSEQFQLVLDIAAQAAVSATAPSICAHHIMYAYFQLEESFAKHYLIETLDKSIPDFLNSLLDASPGIGNGEEIQNEQLSRYLTPVEPYNEIVGRTAELSGIIRALCRKTKNNAILVGGSGVGKTSIVRALAGMIERNDVPPRLQESCVVELNINSLLNGTQYRGELEGRIQAIMEAARLQSGQIIYIDELRSIAGGSRTDESTKDILNLLIPYFKSNDISFIISATYEDIKKANTNDGRAISLFRQIDIEEPSVKETEAIITRLLPSLEEHHGTRYDKNTILHAILSSRRYIQDRCLPDKALDLLDEAGTYAQSEGLKKIDTKTVDRALADICRTDVQSSEKDVQDDLFHMEERLKQKIYGQDNAIKQISEAILMSKAGLLDSGKPIGSFLFVGPTGVGKTELSKVLAQQLHVPLHRFDMSEYSEKHSVAKLIGSPAGYVGYDDGGILTDTIRKNPYCVLLMDEIEKAHEDIYNLLLQIMDYAVITDNKGRKTDFRNVILIMTSNAGARYAHKASVGYERKVNAGTAMAKEVKNVFAPEFINRLSSVVVFNDMDEKMAGLILDDKINILRDRLKEKNIKLELTSEAYEKLLKEGFSPEYGAREMERVVNARITPLLMREILFGKHKKGFTATIKATKEGYDL